MSNFIRETTLKNGEKVLIRRLTTEDAPDTRKRMGLIGMGLLPDHRGIGLGAALFRH